MSGENFEERRLEIFNVHMRVYVYRVTVCNIYNEFEWISEHEQGRVVNNVC